jgi:two-component system cell cycle sensor histidine kinase/response regulator CckA
VQQEREILARLAQRLVFANTPGEVAHFARDAALSLFDFHAFFFDTFDESTQKYANVLAMDTVEDVLMTVTMESPAPSESVRQSMQGKPVLINREPAGSLEHFALFGSMRPSMSLMYVPVKREQRVVGILSVQSYTPHRYTDKDLMVLIQLADLCAVALEKSRFYAALEQSEERYRAVIESANDAIYTKDTERRYTSANPKTLEIFGLSADQLLGKREEELVEEKHAKSARQSDEHVLKTGESIEATERIRRSGRDYILHIVKAPQRNETGKVVGIIGIARDVTELMGAQEQLRRLSNAIEQATEAIVILNQQRIVEYVNPAFTEITGYAPAEVIGNNLDILWSGKHPIEFFEEMWRTAEAGETWSGSIMNRKKDGSLYEEETTLTPVRNAQGAIVNFVEVKRDVTRERELERQLLLAQKMEAIGTLAGGIAHDFNNLLTGVIGYAQLAREQLGENHPCAPDLDQILGGAERAASLTRQLLAFSRRQIIEPTAVNLNHVVNDLLKMLRRVIGESIEITVALAPTLKAIKVDPGQIEQVLMNLCVNARDAMPKGGVLKIETATVELGDEYRLTHPWIYPGEYTLLTVSDTGVGMTEAVRQRIFEPFFTTKEVGRGTGLGLAVVYGIVRQHDGFIHVYSEPGHGTAFKIYFPVREEEDITAIHRDVQLTVGGTETILIAEDEEPVRELMQRILQSFGYKILLAKDGEEAIQVLAEHKDDIDLAILDLVMPRIGGAAIYKSIRSVRRGLKVLFISGYASTSLEDTTVRISGMPFLSKPFTPTALIQRVRSVLDSPPPTDNS